MEALLTILEAAPAAIVVALLLLTAFAGRGNRELRR